MAKVDRTVRDLVGMVERGELRLPEMQREYVWRATRVRDLLDSLYRGYPSGVILAWESDETIATREFAVNAASTSAVRPLLLLDGQQRLTSLAAVLHGKPVSVRGRQRPVEILFNLEHPDELNFVTEVNESSDVDSNDVADETENDIEERWKRLTFVVASKALEARPSWVRVSEIFRKSDGELLKRSGITSLDDPNYDRYTSRLKAVRSIADYEYRMDVLERSKSYEEVTEIFVRVNSLGAKLRSSDLALAQITAKWRGSLQLFLDYQQQVDKRGFDVEIGMILRALIAIVTGQSKFQTVTSLTLDRLQDGWARTTKAFDFALNYVSTNLGIDSPTLLSSPYLLITTAYWADRLNYAIDGSASDAFKQWFLIANAKGRYSRGSSETLLDQDLAVLRQGGSAPELMQRLTNQMGRLDFTTEELAGRTSRSGAFKTMFLAFRQDRARDWATKLEISPKHHGKSDVIEFHHIFPKAYLKSVRPQVGRHEVDDISNLAFIGSQTNKRIKDRAPAVYRHDFETQDLEAQQIDFSDGQDLPENYEAFIEARRAAIALRLNRFLGVSKTISTAFDGSELTEKVQRESKYRGSS